MDNPKWHALLDDVWLETRTPSTVYAPLIYNDGCDKYIEEPLESNAAGTLNDQPPNTIRQVVDTCLYDDDSNYVVVDISGLNLIVAEPECERADAPAAAEVSEEKPTPIRPKRRAPSDRQSSKRRRVQEPLTPSEEESSSDDIAKQSRKNNAGMVGENRKWEQNEDNILIDGISNGLAFVDIAAKLTGRTWVACRSRYGRLASKGERFTRKRT